MRAFARSTGIGATALALLGSQPLPAVGQPRQAPTTETAVPSAVTNAPIATPAVEPSGGAKPESGGNKDGPDWAASLATMLAGVLGFAGALIVERLGWKRRKAEQVRDSQLKKLLGAARNIQQAGNRIEGCKQLFVFAKSNAASANVATLRARAATEATSAALHLEEQLVELRLDFVELRLLQVGDTALNEISALIAQLEAAAAFLKRAGTNDATAATELLAFNFSMSSLIQKAMDGLRQ